MQIAVHRLIEPHHLADDRVAHRLFDRAFDALAVEQPDGDLVFGAGGHDAGHLGGQLTGGDSRADVPVNVKEQSQLLAQLGGVEGGRGGLGDRELGREHLDLVREAEGGRSVLVQAGDAGVGDQRGLGRGLEGDDVVFLEVGHADRRAVALDAVALGDGAVVHAPDVAVALNEGGVDRDQLEVVILVVVQVDLFARQDVEPRFDVVVQLALGDDGHLAADIDRAGVGHKLLTLGAHDGVGDAVADLGEEGAHLGGRGLVEEHGAARADERGIQRTGRRTVHDLAIFIEAELTGGQAGVGLGGGEQDRVFDRRAA